MSKHLNADQMAEWMAGERCPEQQDHLRGCARCRLALEDTLTALGEWRESIQAWSDREYQIAQDRAAERRSPSGSSTVSRWATMHLFWAGGATAACALAAILAWHNGAAPGNSQQDATSPIAVSSAAPNGRHGMPADAVLMRQVDRDVSQTVPDAMAPLMALVSWDGEPVGEGTAAQKENSKQVE